MISKEDLIKIIKTENIFRQKILRIEYISKELELVNYALFFIYNINFNTKIF